MRKIFPILLLSLFISALACSGDDEADTSFNVTWSFEQGDCASNAVENVQVSWGLDGQSPKVSTFACSAGKGKLGDFGSGGTYGLTAEGLDAAGVARVESFGQSVTVGSSGTGGSPVDITLRPKASDVVVSWSLGGQGGCPRDVVLPYFITVYQPPAAAGGALGAKVGEVQESCATGSATVERIPPGEYVVEVDSRAVTPAIRGTKPVTVVAGEDALVSFQF
jgi:hypothetical protein